MTNHMVLSTKCTGPNKACRAASRTGRLVHVIPNHVDGRALIMPTYHYTTVADGIAAVDLAMQTAPTVAVDDDLFACRRMNVPHFLPAGWIDPSRRH